MSSTWGTNIKISIFGESHSKGIGVVIDGIPAGTRLDPERLLHFLARRSSRGGKLDTPRIEKDFPQIISGLLPDEGHPGYMIACGTPVCALIENGNTQSKDYEQLRAVARPGHADYTGFVRYHGCNDIRGGGHFSGRLTAPLCFAGGIAKQYLRGFGIEVGAHIASIGSVQDKPFDPVLIEPDTLPAVQEKFFPVLDDKAGERMQKLIEHCRDQLDSVGGVIECAIAGVPAGIGDPMFDCVESKISSLLFGIPAVKGVEFGLGFGLSSLQGSQANDPFYIRENAASSKEVLTATNHNGGILGGITDGMPVIFRAAIKPTPSIAQKQRTVNFKTGENVELSITGRHDPCIVRRAVPCIESAAAIALMDLMLGSDLVPKNPSRKGGSTR